MDLTVVNKLKTDVYYALDFSIDNNFQALLNNAISMGLASANNTKAEFKQIVITLAKNGQKEALQNIFNVPYLNDATNGTGGYSQFFIENSTPPTAQNRGMDIWTGLLSFVAGGLTGLATTNSALNTPAQTQAEIEAEKKAKEEAERVARNWKIFFWVLGIGTGIALLVWAVKSYNKNKGNK